MIQGSVITLRDASPLSVDVSELLRLPGSTKRVRLAHETAGFGLTLARVEEGAEVELDLRLDSIAEGIQAHGTVSTEVTLECARCLTDVAEDLQLDVNELFLRPGDGEEGETYEVEGDTIDLMPMVRDALVLAMPMNPLCRPDCKGLCPTCGADRNRDDCGHSGARVDIRWGPLAGLREQMEE